ncbi:MAG TPA: hypothetical protein GX507_06480 [Clostridia bacterium]|nr:hypothetical protein [Clostridia bacterium]
MKRETVLNRIRYYEGRLNSIRRENYKTDRDYKRALTLATHCRDRWKKMLDRLFPDPEADIGDPEKQVRE